MCRSTSARVGWLSTARRTTSPSRTTSPTLSGLTYAAIAWTAEPSPAEHLGQGLGLVRAQGVVGEQLPRPIPRLVGVTVDEDEERSRLRAEREVPDERGEQLAPDTAQSDEHDPLRHRSHRPSDPTR